MRERTARRWALALLGCAVGAASLGLFPSPIGAAQAGTGAATGITDGALLPVREHQLANGMRFLLLPRPGAPTVTFVARVGVGSAHDPSDATGLSHLLEHLLFKGTATVGTLDLESEARLFGLMDAAQDSLTALGGPRAEGSALASAERLAARIEALEDSARAYIIPNEYGQIFAENGGQGLNATTSYEATEYTVSLPSNRTQLWFLLEADRMQNPVFREFYAERAVVAEERRSRIDGSSAGLLYEAHLAEAFRTHPYGVPPIGRMQHIESLSRGAVQAHFERYYGPRNTAVAIVGGFEPDSAVAWAERYFGPLDGGEAPPPPLDAEPPQTAERWVEIHFDSDPMLRVGWKIPEATHPDAPALAMLANILVGARDSRLYRRLVRDDRSASAVLAGAEPGSLSPGLFTIQAAPLGTHTPEAVLGAIEEELARIRSEPPTPEELERVRTRLAAASVRRLVSNQGLAYQLVASQATSGDWRETFRLQERMAEVGADDIVEAVDRYFIAEGKTVAILRRPPR